ncbi:MAG: hypothetical protein KGZ75_14640 [Syntrophomonadaceae bacterium]|nr:hypothetical protein [Syntrophomonadaceae bacterium]
MGELIGGTVIQRSFVGRQVSNIIHIASVPLEELKLSEELVEDLLADILGIPSSTVLSTDQYQRIARALRDYPPDSFYPFWHPQHEKYFYRFFEKLPQEHTQKELFSDFLSLISTSSSLSNNWFAWPFVFYPELKDRIKPEINDEALNTAFTCLNARLRRSKEIDGFITEVFTYDIPLGQSPQVKTDSLLSLLETSKKVCIAPLAMGGAQAVNLLAQGNYIAALLTTCTAGAMTLVLIGTVSVGSFLVQKVAQVRQQENNNKRTRKRKQESEGEMEA